MHARSVTTPFGPSIKGSGETMVPGVYKFYFERTESAIAIADRVAYRVLSPYTSSRGKHFRKRFWYCGEPVIWLPLMELCQSDLRMRVRLADMWGTTPGDVVQRCKKLVYDAFPDYHTL